MASIPRSRTYYLDDSLVVLAVDNELYRVHRSVLIRESDVFAGMFALPQDPAQSNQVDGSDDEHPIVIPITTKEEFEAFLDYIYTSPHEVYQADLATWLLLYTIGDRYSCEKLVQRVIRKIENLTRDFSYVERIVLADGYGLRQFVKKACKDFVVMKSHADLGYAETNRLGLGRTTMLFRIHERTCRLSLWRSSTWEEEAENIIAEEMAQYDQAASVLPPSDDHHTTQ
ncbi:hypothetical protein K488DRAFT_85041 [Vararia minispora EC-137]|uniref:Uncharacterized protein n=1 Tax=Vararia minispora EC-137 TaxID=1314806 RepID=A0ACB8QNS0_9AGAM|nr:hypothetical protein K488DRAFT_85041 [Vararia minispora EC-137]